MRIINALSAVEQHVCIVEDKERSQQPCCGESLIVLVVSTVNRHYRTHHFVRNSCGKTYR